MINQNSKSFVELLANTELTIISHVYKARVLFLFTLVKFTFKTLKRYSVNLLIRFNHTKTVPKVHHIHFRSKTELKF